MSPTDYKNWIKHCETNLRTGNIESVRTSIAITNTTKIPEKYRLAYAQICRRAGRPELGLKALAHAVQSIKHHASDEEQIEYSMCLRNIGAVNEAQLRLSNVNIQKSPSGVLCEMFIGFSQWDPVRSFTAAQYYMNNFVQPNYQTALVELNMAAALVGLEKFDQASELLNPKLVEFQLKGWQRLLSNAHELMAQILIQKGKLEQAKSHLELARRFGISENVKDTLFVDRWVAVIQSKKDGDISRLKHLAQKARKLKHFETLRAIDFEILQLHFDQLRFDHLYYGTPYPKYKEMLSKKIGSASKSYTLNSGSDHILELERGTIDQNQIYPPGGKIALLMAGLFSDLYAPVGLGSLFGQIFPNELFDAERSFKKIHQLIYRGRRVLSEHKLDAKIEEHDRGYRLNFGKTPIAVQFNDSPSRSKEEHYLKLLKVNRCERAFSVHQAEQSLSLSMASTYRVIQYGINKNILLRMGFGAQTMYHFVDTHKHENT